MKYVLGIDIGGTAIKHGLVDDQGMLSRFASTPTPHDDPLALELIPLIDDIFASYADAQPEAVGVAIPGLVTAAGIAEFSGTLGFRNLDMLGLLKKALPTPVTLIHDVTAGGLAEARIGAAQGAQCAVLLQIGTAIAASLIFNGEVYHPHPAVGEIGHVPTVYDRPCPCGLRGCLEMTASGGAVARNFREITGEELSAREVFQRASSGDPQAQLIRHEFVDALSSAIVWLSAVIGPDVIVLSGGVSTAGENLVSSLDQELDSRLSFHKRPQIVPSPLKDTAGCVGAGLYALQALR
jgi:glucokinase